MPKKIKIDGLCQHGLLIPDEPGCACTVPGCNRGAKVEDLKRCSCCNWLFHPDEGTEFPDGEETYFLCQLCQDKEPY